MLPAAIAATIACLGDDTYYPPYTLAFLTGATFASYPQINKPKIQLLTIAGATLSAYIIQPNLITVPVAAVAISTQFLPGTFSPATIAKLAKASNLSYHFYLVHGPIYPATAKELDKSLPATLIAGTIAAIAALVLYQIARTIRT